MNTGENKLADVEALEIRREKASKKISKYYGRNLSLRKDSGEISEENVEIAERKIREIEYYPDGTRKSGQMIRRITRILKSK